MKIHIVGKVRRSGVSKKTGRPFDFVELHYTSVVKGVEGQAAKTTIIDPALYPYDQISAGSYDIQFDDKGAPLSLAPIQQTPAKT